MDSETRTVLWDLNERCNLKCRYCYHLMDGIPWSGKEVKLDVALEHLEFMSNEGVNKIYYVGGEPFLHRDLKSILKYAKEKGIFNVITTNGSLISKYKDAELMSYVDMLEISVDSLDMEYNKTVGRVIPINKIEETISITQSMGIKIQVITVATKKNLDQIAALAHYCHNLGIDAHKIQTVWLPKSNALFDEFALNPEQIQTVKEIVKSIVIDKPILQEYFELIETSSRKEVFPYNCKAFKSFAYLSVDGVFYRCPSLNTPISSPLFGNSREVCNHMSFDCLSCFNLVEDFNFEVLNE